MREIMANENLTTPRKIFQLNNMIIKIENDDRLKTFLLSWLELFFAISNTSIPGVSDVTPEMKESLIAGKERLSQRIGNLDSNVRRADEYKALLQNYLNSKYDPKIQAAQQMSAN